MLAASRLFSTLGLEPLGVSMTPKFQPAPASAHHQQYQQTDPRKSRQECRLGKLRACATSHATALGFSGVLVMPGETFPPER